MPFGNEPLVYLDCGVGLQAQRIIKLLFRYLAAGLLGVLDELVVCVPRRLLLPLKRLDRAFLGGQDTVGGLIHRLREIFGIAGEDRLLQRFVILYRGDVDVQSIGGILKPDDAVVQILFKLRLFPF